MDILEFYRAQLQSLGCPISPEGLVSTTINGSSEPLIVTKADNKRLTLPTPVYLNDPREDVLVQFHPMSEGIDRGESEVLTALKRLITANLMFRICDVMILVAKVASSPEMQKQLKPSATKRFSQYLGNFDAKTTKLVTDILGKINPNDRDSKGRACSIINITLARRINIFEESYQRAAVVSFPIMEAIITAKEEMQDTGALAKIFGVTPGRKNQYDLLINLFNFIFPDAETVGSWSAGSNTLAAPYYHALLTTYIKIAERINEVVKMVSKDAKKEYANLLYDLSWKEHVGDLSQYVGCLPPAKHNKGKAAGKKEEDEEVKTAITRMPAEVQPQVVNQQVVQPQPIVVQETAMDNNPPFEMNNNQQSSSNPLDLLKSINQRPAQVAGQPMLVNGQYVYPVPQQQQVLVQPQVIQNQQPMYVQQPVQQVVQQPQDPMVIAIQLVRDPYGNTVQQQIQLPLSQFQQLVAQGQLPQQQPQLLQQQPQQQVAMIDQYGRPVQQQMVNQGYSGYQDGAQPVQHQPQYLVNGYQQYGNQGTIRMGGRRTVSEAEMGNRNGVVYY